MIFLTSKQQHKFLSCVKCVIDMCIILPIYLSIAPSWVATSSVSKTEESNDTLVLFACLVGVLVLFALPLLGPLTDDVEQRR